MFYSWLDCGLGLFEMSGGLDVFLIFILLPIDFALPATVNVAFLPYVGGCIISLERLLIDESEHWRRGRTGASFQW